MLTILACPFYIQGAKREHFKPSIWRNQIYYNSELFQYFWCKFFEIIFFILENVKPQLPLLVIYQICVFFFWSTIYTQQQINTCSGFMEQWTRLPCTQKRLFICPLLRVTRLVLFDEFEWVKPCKFAVVVSLGQNKKLKERQKADRVTKFCRIRWLGEE